MSNIILHDKEVGGNLIQTLNARELYEGLGVKGDFTSWIKDQIKARELIENKDFVVFMANHENPRGGRPRAEYFLTIRAAKHITAMSRSEGGEQYRTALFDLEEGVASYGHVIQSPHQKAIELTKDIIELARLFGAPMHVALIEASKAIEPLGIDTMPLLKSSEYMDNIDVDDHWLEPTELGKRSNKTGAEMNKLLAAIGLQAKINGEWIPTDSAEGLFQWHSWKSEHSTKSGRNLKWHVKRVEQLVDNFFEVNGGANDE